MPTVPYLGALGDYGTGKTRFLEVAGSVTFRGIRASGATTPSPIFRMLDRYHGTLILDEADFDRSDAKAELVKILNSGHRRGSPVLRSDGTSDKNWEPRSSRIARMLGVSEATISRDIIAVLRPQPVRRCSACGSKLFTKKELERMDAIIDMHSDYDEAERESGASEQVGSPLRR